MKLPIALAAPLLALLLATSASAQGVLQSGNVTPGHISTWATNGVIQDGGAVTANNSLSGGSTTSIAASGTYYCSTSGCATTAPIAAIVPFTGTAVNLNVAVATAPGSGQTITATLMTGTYGSLSASAATCQIIGTATSCRDATHQINIAAGQAWAIRLVASSGATSTAGETFGFQYINATPPSPTNPYVLQSGVITSGHVAQWTTNGVISDGGLSSGAVIGPSTNGDLVCVNSSGLPVDCGYNFSNPPPIGNVTPNTGAFTTVTIKSASPAVSPVITTYNVTVSTSLEPYTKWNATLAGTVTANNSADIDALHWFVIGSDNLAAGSYGLYNAYFGEVVGGAAETGNRTNVAAFLEVTSATNNGNPNPYFYVAAAAIATANVNDNGTALSAAGNLVAANDVATLKSGATYWNALEGREVDCEVDTGASVGLKQCVKIVLYGSDAVQGSTSDYALGFVKSSTASGSWEVGIAFGEPTGYWPISSTGTIIGTTTGLSSGSPPAYDAANGIDWSNVTFSGCAFKSVAFCVNGAGALSAGGGSALSFNSGYNSPGAIGTFIPSATVTTSNAVVAIESTRSYSTGATYSPSVFVGTLYSFTGTAAWGTGLISEVNITANSGAGAYAEAVRGTCVAGSSLSAAPSCYGGVFLATIGASQAFTYDIAIEGQTAQTYANAPVPGSFSKASFSAAFNATNGNGVSGAKTVDTAYQVNPYTGAPFQAGFSCQEDTAGSAITSACFYAAVTATNGMDLSNGTWSNAAILLPNNSFIVANKAGGGTQSLIGLNSSNQVALGASATVDVPATTAASSTTTGAIITAGGIGVAKTSYFGGSLYNTGIASSAQADVVCTTSAGLFSYQVSATGCAASSERFKDMRSPLTREETVHIATSLIQAKRWTYKKDIDFGDDSEYVGFTAEQIAEIDDRFITRDDAGLPYAVKHQQLAEVAIAGFSLLVENLQSRIDQLERRVH
jgi:hypothetical protein